MFFLMLCNVRKEPIRGRGGGGHLSPFGPDLGWGSQQGNSSIAVRSRCCTFCVRCYGQSSSGVVDGVARSMFLNASAWMTSVDDEVCPIKAAARFQNATPNPTTPIRYNCENVPLHAQANTCRAGNAQTNPASEFSAQMLVSPGDYQYISSAFRFFHRYACIDQCQWCLRN